MTHTLYIYVIYIHLFTNFNHFLKRERGTERERERKRERKRERERERERESECVRER